MRGAGRAAPAGPERPGGGGAERAGDPVPGAGPRFAAVTLDLFQPVGSPFGGANVALALQLARESADVRLLFHAVPVGSSQAERGAELLLAAAAEPAFWPLCDLLYSRPELLNAAEEQNLRADLGTLGLDAERLLPALRERRYRAAVQARWRAEREQLRYPPELWVNGRRLRGPLSETVLRDVVERQRQRAGELLRQGVALTALYERLLRLEREERGEPEPSASPRRQRAFVDLFDAPAARPVPVMLVYFGDGAHGYLRYLREVVEQEPHRGRVRLVLRELRADGKGPPDPRAVSQARQLGIAQGPALVVNGILLRSLPPPAVLESLLQDELELGLVERLLQRATSTRSW